MLFLMITVRNEIFCEALAENVDILPGFTQGQEKSAYLCVCVCVCLILCVYAELTLRVSSMKLLPCTSCHQIQTNLCKGGV